MEVGGARRRPRSVAEVRDELALLRGPTAFLQWQATDGRQLLRPLESDAWRLTIGRAAGCDIVLADDLVSRVHALIEPAGNGWTIADEGVSRNGTWVNGTRVHGRRRLTDRDVVVLGRTRLVFREPAAIVATASTLEAPEAELATRLSPAQRRTLIALCRPLHDGTGSTPATNRAIAAELVVTIGAVKSHLRVLSDRFGLAGLRQNEKRARLAQLGLGVLAPHEFDGPAQRIASPPAARSADALDAR